MTINLMCWSHINPFICY
uniref:Uncharacterized protein n=1 Tax=Rhizophora mucronata TaxID=61149 RepID=A0A2P2QB36_RHIMU